MKVVAAWVAACLCTILCAEGRGAPPPRSKGAMRVVWRQVLAGAHLQSHIATVGGVTYLSVGAEVHGLENEHGRRLWTFQPRTRGQISPPTLTRDGTAVVVDGFGASAVDRHGNELWRASFLPFAGASEFVFGHAPIIGPTGSVFATGLDGNLHALDPVSGKETWRFSIGTYASGAPAIPLAASTQAVLLDTRPTPGESPQLVAIAIGRSPKLGFVARMPNDVSSFVASDKIGFVVTSYVETRSTRGSSMILWLDKTGEKRWTAEPGSNQYALALVGEDAVLTRARDSAGSDPGSVLEMWSSAGTRIKTSYVSALIESAIVGHDGRLYIVGCTGNSAFVQEFNRGLKSGARLDLGGGCSVAVTLDEKGRLLAAREVSARAGQNGPAIEVVAVQTPSVTGPAVGWSMPRANSLGSASLGVH